jgi:predicted Zn-dependent protease
MDIRARFNDGRTAESLEARLRIEGGYLIVEGAEGTLARWRLPDIEMTDGPAPPLRLACGSASGRITMTDTEAIRTILAALPKSASRGESGGPSALQAVAYTLATAAVLGILYVAWPHVSAFAARHVPASWEDRMGERTAREIARLLVRDPAADPFCNDAAGRAALDRLTARLALGTESPYRFRVRVVRSHMLNAFAAPGGHIVLVRGLIDKAKSADEVAGVLAHEMGHVSLRHATRAMMRRAALSALATLLFGDGTFVTETGQVLVELSYSREAEAEADRFALEKLGQAGIRTDGFARFFERLAKKENQLPELLKYFSTHPASGTRAEQARAQDTSDDPGMSARDWAALKGICG